MWPFQWCETHHMLAVEEHKWRVVVRREGAGMSRVESLRQGQAVLATVPLPCTSSSSYLCLKSSEQTTLHITDIIIAGNEDPTQITAAVWEGTPGSDTKGSSEHFEKPFQDLLWHQAVRNNVLSSISVAQKQQHQWKPFVTYLWCPVRRVQVSIFRYGQCILPRPSRWSSRAVHFSDLPLRCLEYCLPQLQHRLCPQSWISLYCSRIPSISTSCQNSLVIWCPQRWNCSGPSHLRIHLEG